MEHTNRAGCHEGPQEDVGRKEIDVVMAKGTNVKFVEPPGKPSRSMGKVNDLQRLPIIQHERRYVHRFERCSAELSPTGEQRAAEIEARKTWDAESLRCDLVALLERHMEYPATIQLLFGTAPHTV
jgi:hypothetical protein